MGNEFHVKLYVNSKRKSLKEKQKKREIGYIKNKTAQKYRKKESARENRKNNEKIQEK